MKIEKNIMFFLVPKSQVAYIEIDSTLRQVMEKMDYHKYTAIPILDNDGYYVGTLTEGDILRCIKKENLYALNKAEKIKLLDIERLHDCKPIHSNSNMDDLLQMAINQNFVPVLDDKEHFIGIITRKKIIQFAYDELKNN